MPNEGVNNQHSNKLYIAEDACNTRCGEIFITSNRVILFHCSICDSRHEYFTDFLEHLSIHYDGHEIFESKEDESTKDDVSNVFENEVTISFDDNMEEERDGTEIRYNESTEISTFPDKQSEIDDMEEQYLEDFNSEESNSVGALDEALHDYKDLQYQKTTSLTKVQKVDIFGCVICGKNFKSRAKLTRHLNIHSEERNFKCSICGFAFKEKANLNAHLRRHSGQKAFSCGVCPKKFFTRTEVENHMRVHTGEKPYICSHCGMTFAALSGMIRCVKRHTEDPPYTCSFCEKGFWSKAEYKDHLVVHTKEKPYACPICSARFPRRKSWRYHINIHNKS